MGSCTLVRVIRTIAYPLSSPPHSALQSTKKELSEPEVGFGEAKVTLGDGLGVGDTFFRPDSSGCKRVEHPETDSDELLSQEAVLSALIFALAAHLLCVQCIPPG
ncbi:hypothetical protein CDAR_56841 [Caerostris darwini]|uniref:Uncharacterized protein n=1 Tax=Caerostris darwini TaxID=1538125 RepID=A0AAV4UMZ1_9ARAC|nr:hypothetical protein CDAR_56841 [Caerostris darwini]